MTDDREGFTGLTTAKNAFEAGAITALLSAAGIWSVNRFQRRD